MHSVSFLTRWRRVPAAAALLVAAACAERTVFSPATEDVTAVAGPLANTTNVYTSGSHVRTWDPILPTTGYADNVWPTTVCTNTPAVGLNANWQNEHAAYEVAGHPWFSWFANEPWFFVAPWINSFNNLASTASGGPSGGQSWTKYRTQVSGNGSFVIRLLADNCSWIYLDGTLVGVQGTDLTKNSYGLTLNGTHTLEFIIWDGNGAAGGMFKLETTSNPPPPLNPDLDGDGHPNAQDAYPLDPTRWQLALTGRVRDFKAYNETGGHPDFERYLGNDGGIVAVDLGSDKLPVYARTTGGTSTTSGKAAFDQWYRDVPGVNMARNYDLLLTRNANGTYTYSNPEYFPIDNQLFGNYSYNNFAHNFHFTTEIHTTFAYNGGETFSFTGDDDVWVFINGKRVIDLGGVHGPQTASVALNSLGLTVGQNYSLDIFQAERRTGGSSFSMTTTLQLVSVPPPSDVTPPVVTPVVSGTLGANGWYTSDVNVSWTVSDGESAVSNSTGCGATTVTTDTNGQTFTCTATSAGGTATGSVTVKRDATAPAVSPTVTGTVGANGWYTSNVNVTWAVSDAMSGIGSSTGCSATTTTTDNAGTTYTCTAVNGAGLSTTQSVSAKRDATIPVIAFGGNAGTYTVDQTVAITCSATDAMSGIATSSCPGASGAAYTFGVGVTTRSASAEDNAGNAATASTSFTVQVTGGSLCNLVKLWVTQAGVANSMCKQLENRAYEAFRNHVSAQSGKFVAADKAAILIALSRSL